MDKKKKIIIGSISSAVVLILAIVIGIVVGNNSKNNKDDTSLPAPKIVDNNQRGTEEMLGHNDGDGSGKAGPHGSTSEKFIGSWIDMDNGHTLSIAKNADGTYTFVDDGTTKVNETAGTIEYDEKNIFTGTVNASDYEIEFVDESGNSIYNGTHKYEVSKSGYDYYMTLDKKIKLKYNETFSSGYRIPGLDQSLADGKIVPGGEVIEIDPNNPNSEIPSIPDSMFDDPDIVIEQPTNTEEDNSDE